MRVVVVTTMAVTVLMIVGMITVLIMAIKEMMPVN